jgi:hypothetical protein
MLFLLSSHCLGKLNYASFSAASIDLLNRSVPQRNWHPGQFVPGFLNQLAVLLIFVPHFGQVTWMTLSSITHSPYKNIEQWMSPR